MIVSSGSEVTWINADTVGYTATARRLTDGPSGQFDTGTISPGESKSVIVLGEGEQSLLYYCTIHPFKANGRATNDSLVLQFNHIFPFITM